MACIIVSKSRNFFPEIWANIEPCEKSVMYSKKNLTDKYCCDIINQGCGFFIKINKKLYIVASYFVTGEICYDVKSIITINKNIKEIKLDIIKQFPSFRITILKCHFESNELEILSNPMNYYDESEIDFPLESVAGQLDLCVNEYCDNKIIYKEYIVTDANVVNTQISSIVLPCIPIINCNVSHLKYDGLDGSLLRTGTKIVGMTLVYDNNDKMLQAIPIVIIKYILKTLYLTQNNELYGMRFDTSIASIDICGIPSLTGHVITNTYGILYKLCNSKSYIKLIKGDVIIEINETKINYDGTIRFEDIGYNVSILAYIMLSTLKSNTIKIELLTKQKNIYEKKNPINIVCNSYNSMYDIHIDKQSKYLHYKSYVFAELSEELMFHLYLKYKFKPPEILNTKNENKYILVFKTDYIKKILFVDSFETTNFPTLEYIQSTIDKPQFSKFKMYCHNGNKNIFQLFI
jgi:hypothetical protein